MELDSSPEVVKSSDTETQIESHQRLNNVCIDDLFDSARQSLVQTLDSSGSVAAVERSLEGTSSTTGFDVGQLSGTQKLRSTATKESYDENDEEVAEVLGESYKEEEDQVRVWTGCLGDHGGCENPWRGGHAEEI